jgi:uncharacterized protein (DUF305 family)
MTRSSVSVLAVGLVAAWAVVATGLRAQGSAQHGGTAADSALPFTEADVHFMQGMIGHHSQAVVMAGWAPTHGASSEVKILAGRIDVSQRDEIVSMQRWLREHHQMVPDATGHMSMDMGPGGHDLMPGMLTPEQMAQLDHATGPDFDRLFLAFMIQHHEGALSMVKQLFDSQGAGQDEVIFKFASDVAADQTAEIDRMTTLLMAQAGQ